MRHVEDAAARLEQARETEPSILVSYSGGKDSLAVMDLVCRVFDPSAVHAFMMEPIPGLRYTAQIALELADRHGIELKLYPHWTMLNAIGGCMYCDGNIGRDDLLKSCRHAKLADIHALARAGAGGVRSIAAGHKRADSLWRRRMMAIPSAMRDIVCPLANWTRAQVLEYLASRKIPVPEDMGGTKYLKNGIDFNTRSVCWLYDNMPDDFERLQFVFPYVGAIIARRTFYGIET
jgi:3'-phosphoadenosine 5'-phosphosulfate sulfotransferase (PAPS reductase)/FAD synthetase